MAKRKRNVRSGFLQQVDKSNTYNANEFLKIMNTNALSTYYYR